MEVKKSSKSSCSFGISSIDMTGSMFSFEFPTFSRRLKTKVGSILVVMIGLIAILATTLIGSKYFDTSSPAITFSNQIAPVIPHNLAKELALPALTVYMDGAPIQEDISRFATIKATFLHIGYDLATGRTQLLSYIVSDFVNCKELNDPYYNKLLSAIEDNNGFKGTLQCPNFKGNYSLADVYFDPHGSSGKPELKTMALLVSPCSREDSSECVSPTSAKDLKLVVASPQKAIVPSNYTHPYQIRVSMEEIQINPFRRKFFTFESKMTKIVDLRNEIFGEKDRAEYLSTHLYTQDSVPRFGAPTTCPKAEGAAFTHSCPEYIELIHQRGNEMIHVKRQYYSPTQIIGEIGGVLKVALMFVMVYAFYIKMRMKSFIIERIFSGKKGSGKNNRRQKLWNQGKTENRKKETLVHPGRVKLLARSRSRISRGPQHSKKVKEECYRSVTCVSNLQNNINLLDLLENLTLNENSRKMLSQGILIKRMIMTSPKLRESYQAYRKKFMRSLRLRENRDQLSEQLDRIEEENEEEKQSQQGDQEEKTCHLSAQIGCENILTGEKIKEELKSLIESKLRGDYADRFSKKQAEAKCDPANLFIAVQPEIFSNIPKAKNLGGQVASDGSSGLDLKKVSDENCKGSRRSQNESPLRKSPFRKNSGPFQLSSLGRRSRMGSLHLGRSRSRPRRKLSSGKKILVKSNFGASRHQFVKDQNIKQK